MPEIKNNFLQGKMNKDLDERLIPNGQYRDAWNVEVSTAEDSSVGTVKNILGNKRVEDIIPSGFQCVGSIANEKENKLYWFVSSYEKDAIIEYDVENDVVNPVFVDLNAGTYKAALMFSGNVITGINIIDDLLFWTDNNSNPKKINIKECIKGTPDFDTHTQLIFEHGSFDGITIKYTAPSTSVGYWNEPRSRKGKYFWFESNQIEKLFPREFDGVAFAYNTSYFDAPGPDLKYMVRHYRDGEFLGERWIKVWEGILSSNGSHARVHPYVAHPGHSSYVPGTPESEYWPWHVGDVIFGSGVNIDMEERHITVIKPKPLNTFSVKINHTQNLDSTSNVPNLFETKFPRFSYRYKYRDGEFSCFAPFTNPVFNPKYTKDTNKSSDVNVFHNKDTVYDIKEPHNKAMVNSIHSIELSDFITAQTPEDVIEIDILYKQEDSPVIYSIGTIEHLDSEWHDWSNHEGYNLGEGRASAGGRYQAKGGFTKGKYVVTTENIYAALPANQLLRPWDNVPRKALAQEITGNRIVYGNYLQNYNLSIKKPKIKVSYNDRSNQIGSFDTQGLPSIKSQRNYQLGIVYCDKHGRETPVLTSNEAAVNIPWQEKDGKQNASKSLQLNTSVVSNFPEWVDSLKFFVKETSNEYYNLMMDRAWVTKTTYELDNSEGHLWISFPSSDRNKISEEDYIILKKKVGTGEGQIGFENKFKVIDIKNEAPDAIKYELVNLGVKTNNTSDILTSGGNKLFSDINSRIDKEVNIITIQFGSWKSHGGYRGALEKETVLDSSDYSAGGDVIKKNLYLSWRRLDSTGVGVSSKKYKVIGGWKGTGGYVLDLSTPITKIDADIAHVNGDSSTAETHMHQNLIFQVEEKRLKDTEDFSGKFFVKISKNQVTDLIESGEPTSILDQYQISAKTPSWYWQDDVIGNFSIIINQDGSPNTIGGTYGLTNWYGHDQSPDYTNNSIQLSANNNVGNVTADNKVLRVTDWYGAWDGILSKFGPTFFVDSMHVASGQGNASNYAKYNCILWAGSGSGTGDSNDPSAWSYPPFKTWLTDFQKKSEFLSTQMDSNLFVNIQVSGCWGSWPSIPITSTWFEGNLISTSPEISNNSDWNDLGVDGWVGSLQNVDRLHNEPGSGKNFYNQVNGLEGFITTNDYHTTGTRRWFSGITGNQTEHGVGVDTKTYSDNNEVGRHFMHLSFFAPGKNLHSGNWSGLNQGVANTNGDKLLYGIGSFAANLQGIWGGGHFTGSYPNEKFGTGTIPEQHFHLCMEGNNAADGSFLPETPGPGVGYGYNVNYRELHERQWDPTFSEGGDPDNKIRDFIRNLHAGSQFKFSTDTPAGSAEVYTIKKVGIKKLYNHTSWRKPYNRYIAGTGTIGVDYGYIHGPNIATENVAYRSVEQLGLEWLDTVGSNVNGDDAKRGYFRDKIVDFGKASNRRVCYIIELDKNPTAGPYYNPIADDDDMSADVVNGDFANIEFLEQVESVLLSDLSKFPAIWEVDPRKKEVDLDIYYEASSSIPIKITSDTNELFAPLGCSVEILDSSIAGRSRLISWDGLIAEFEPGFVRGDGTYEIDYTGISFKFIREDGSFTIAEAGGQQLIGEIDGNKKLFGFREDIGGTIRAGLSWYNCFSFGNGLESNRISDDFNEMFITNGVKASTTTQETYEEERRPHGLIYSGLYNSNSGVNDLNQFIMAEKITKDINPTYGSIQKLFQRRISLVTFCEDRVLSIMSNKDAIYNADGNMQLVATANVLGDVNPFVGDFGISRNPESFVSESYRAYFTDKQRGAVLRLSKDGLTPISKTGMHDWFRDNLPKYTSLIGTYDSYKEDYNITLSNAYAENIIYDTFLGHGEESTTISSGISNRVANAGVYDGVYFQYLYDQYDIATNPLFEWGTVNEGLESTVTVINYDTIPVGHYQGYVPSQPHVPYDPGTGAIGTVVTPAVPGVYGAPVPGAPIPGAPVPTTIPGVTTPGAPIPGATIPGATTPGVTTTSAFIPATYSATLPQSSQGRDGYFISANYAAGGYYVGGQSTGPQSYWGNTFHLYHNARRYINNPGTSSAPNIGWVNESSPYNFGTTLNTWGSGTGYVRNGAHGVAVETYPGTAYPVYQWTNAVTKGSISGVITQSTDGGGGILFDRVGRWGNTISNFVEIRQCGIAHTGNITGQLNDAYSAASGNTSEHTSIYNGDEIHIAIEIKCYATLNQTSGGSLSSDSMRYGYNVIQPKIVLLDGGTYVSNDKFVSLPSGAPPWPSGWGSAWQGNQGTYKPYEFMQSSIISTGMSPTAGMGGAYSISTSGIPTDYEDMNFLNWKDSSTVTWDSTGTIDTLYDTTPNTITSGDTKTITLGASFKFRDPNQQNADGSYSVSGGDGVEEIKVVNDLRIRISQFHDGPANAPSGFSGYPWMAQQLWEIQKVRIVKGFGVTAPHVPEITTTSPPTTSPPTTSPPTAGPPVTSPPTSGPPTAGAPVPGGPIPGAFTPGTAAILITAQSFVAETPFQPAIHEVLAVPPVVVPAWTKVDHNNPTWFTDWTLANVAGNMAYLHAHTLGAFGNNYEAGPTQTGWGQNPLDAQNPTQQLSPNQLINYIVPEDWVGLSPPGPGPYQGSPFGPTAAFPLTPLDPYPGIGYNTASVESYNNLWMHIRTTSGGGNYVDIKQDITNDPWIVGEWYLVDVEYDWGFNPNTGAGHGSPDGSFILTGLGSNSGIVAQGWNNPIAENGVGVYRGTPPLTDIQLVQVDRTEYGATTSPANKVLRAIFKVPSDCWRAQQASRLEQFVLRIYSCPNDVKIKKIITRKLSEIPTTGGAANWTRHGGDADHSFDKPELYWLDNKLCFNASDAYTPHIYWVKWQQLLGGQTPGVTPLGWRLNFTVSDHPFYLNDGDPNNNFYGALRGWVGRTDTNAVNGHEGMYFTGVDTPGDYEIKFNMDGDIGRTNLTGTAIPWSVDGPTGHGVYINSTSSNINWTGGIADMIAFECDLNVTDLRCAVGTIFLTDETQIFQGGDAGSWNFDGFNTSTDNYIHWNVTNENLVFWDCPAVDPNATTSPTKLININQWIDNTTPINRYEKYRIEFSYLINTGKISVYYYNAEGYGFKILDISSNTPTTFNQIVTIGDDEWESVNAVDAAYAADLKETFVIGLYDDSGAVGTDVNGWIDDISMTRVYDVETLQETTVTFSEDVNGWTSFKSFYNSSGDALESGLSISKKYFTINDGGLFQHYVPMIYDTNNAAWTTEIEDNGITRDVVEGEAENYNIFYGNEDLGSIIRVVLNSDPSTIKTFSTLNYEGSQAYIIDPSTIGSGPGSEITPMNAQAYAREADIDGWQCTKIKTDMDTGSVVEFIKKEGKWFNYIRGEMIQFTQPLDTNRFSVQGIGVASSVTSFIP